MRLIELFLHSFTNFCDFDSLQQWGDFGEKNLSFLGEGIAFAADIGSWVWFHVVPEIFLVPLCDHADVHVATTTQVIEYTRAYGFSDQLNSFIPS